MVTGVLPSHSTSVVVVGQEGHCQAVPEVKSIACVLGWSYGRRFKRRTGLFQGLHDERVQIHENKNLHIFHIYQVVFLRVNSL